MSDYWLNLYTASASTYGESPLKQVGKTINGIEVTEDQIGLIVERIENALELCSTDTLFDLCCGNGLMTVRLAERAGTVTGIDFTESLLEVARQRHARPNTRYLLANVLELSGQETVSANKFLMYEGLQYLSVQQFGGLLNNLSRHPAGTRFFAGGIPDHQRLHEFYNSEEKFHFYQECEQAGRPHLGRWWLEDEVRDLAAKSGYKVKILPQPESLYTAYYRFDALLEKQG